MGLFFICLILNRCSPTVTCHVKGCGMGNAKESCFQDTEMFLVHGLLCKPSTSSRVYITVLNSTNPSHVHIRPCKQGKPFPLLIKNALQ